MAELGLDEEFDPTTQDTSQRVVDNLPPGDYVIEATETDIKITRESGKVTKALLSVTHTVIEPEEYRGRKLFQNINYVHTTPLAQEIGQKDLAKLCRAVGHEGKLLDSDDLRFKPFTVTVKIGKDSKTKNADGTPEYPGKAEIGKYHYADEGDVPPAKVAPQAATDRPATHAAPAGRTAPATAKPASSGSPWKKAA